MYHREEHREEEIQEIISQFKQEGWWRGGLSPTEGRDVVTFNGGGGIKV